LDACHRLRPNKVTRKTAIFTGFYEEFANRSAFMQQFIMHGRSSNGDVAQNALRVVEQAIGEPLKPARKTIAFPRKPKNPAAVALGKLGGMKGGKARAAELSPERRKEIAQKAAKARWAKVEKL
jgi:hypothetical protein